MNTEEALQFLRENQPLPPDDQLDDRIKTFEEVRQFFEEHIDPRCLELLLNAFGDGSGFGVYQLVEDTIRMYPPDLVVPILQRTLCSPSHSVRYWNAQVAEYFSHESLVEPLARMLEEEDPDLRWAAATALWPYDTPEKQTILREHLQHETDEELRGVILEDLGET
ncbi:MAG: HEAT repeat domain-containing protein [Chloroflexi bacterium]|nr:HEAT repeat domain-containing protein [Chloroflexota bacterium]